LIPRVEILASRVVLHKPSTYQIKAAAKAFRALTGEKPTIGIQGFFPPNAIYGLLGQYPAGLDLRPTGSTAFAPCPVIKVGTTYLTVKLRTGEEDLIPARGSEIEVTLEMP
jgi:hypothetical protein